jgi:glucokinase
MILAADIGGTKTLLGLFDARPARPRPIVVREFATVEYGDLESMVSDFSRDEAVAGEVPHAACFGVAGPVIGNAATLTNVPWTVDGDAIARRFRIAHFALLNDLQAMAYAVPVLEESELHVLQEGEAMRGGNIALIAAGTGLGEALLHNVNGQFVPSASEGGHSDFPARTDREIELLRDVRSRFGRASVEHVVSGRGLVNVHRITHRGGDCTAVRDTDSHDAPSQISTAALERSCGGCVEALEMFVEAYGAEAGNLALRAVATGGVFVGGGIAPKILPALTSGRFMQAFVSKPPLDEMLRRMPVRVILNSEVGLLGAAVHAAGLGSDTRLTPT